MKTSLLLLFLAIGGINLIVSDEVYFLLILGLVILFIIEDDAIIYNSSYSTLLPFALLVVLGVARGFHNEKTDLYRDVYIYAKNISYFLCGILLSKYIPDFNSFFKYFLRIAFFAALVHIGMFLMNMQSASSLESIRKSAGYGNSVEGVMTAIFLSCFIGKDFRKLIDDFTSVEKIMMAIISLSLLLYFSRNLIVVLVVISFFLCNIIYIRKIFSSKNAKVLRAILVVGLLSYLISLIASLGPSDSPLQRLVDKFEQIPQEVTWNAEKNTNATLDDINDNWRGYEAYQGLLKFEQGDNLQKSLGFGFGERVDLGITMKLAGDLYDSVPILHNEFMSLTLKCGIAGVVLFLLFIYRVGFRKIEYSADDEPEIYYSYQMLSALSLVSILSTFIGFGLLDPSNAAIPIFIGFFWGNAQRHIQEEIRISKIKIPLTISSAKQQWI